MPNYQVQKSTSIRATPEQVFQLVSDFQTWTSWSPWLLVEPDASVVISSDSRSVGSTYRWKGDITGEGEIEHIQLDENRLIEQELRFLKPFKSICQVIFTIEPCGSDTKLTWTMNGKMPWFLFFLVSTMKTFIGMDFQRGLNMIKDLIELGKVPARSISLGVQRAQAIRMAGICGSCSVDAVGPALAASMKEADREFRKAGIRTDLPMIAVYTKFRLNAGVFEYLCGYLLPDGATLSNTTTLKEWSQPAGRAFQVEHQGSYRHLGNAWNIANQLARKQKLKQCKTGVYEIYRNSPAVVQEEDLVTDIFLPLR